MGKLLNIVLFNSIILLLFYTFGLIGSNNVLLSWLLNPSIMQYVIWSAISVAIIAGFTASFGFNFLNNELAAASSMLAISSVIVFSAWQIYSVLDLYISHTFAILLMSPILLWEIMVLWENWRGRDN